MVVSFDAHRKDVRLAVCKMSSLLNGIGGTVHGSFFRVNDCVDTTKPPGSTTAQCPQTLSETLQPIVTGQAFLFSPSFSWFLLACFVWWMVPYELRNTERTWHDHLWQRLLVNHVLAFGYVGFWHITLYWWNWGKRPFVKHRSYQWGKVLHNVFYTWLGVVHWTVIEVLIIHAYQIGKLPYRHETLSFYHHPALVVFRTVLISTLLPKFRDIHFYFMHRLFHARFLYKYIHSLHHRNTDIEPFAGLCMHPLEHQFYYSCYVPCLILRLHPFILFWMGVHVVLSPAASHSGYEDHFSANLVHYLHHRHTDCNYGVPQSIPLDLWFGTFRGQLQAKEDVDKQTTATNVDPKARLGWIPEHPYFNASWILLWWTVWYFREFFYVWPMLGAVLVSLGPICLAWMACLSSDMAGNHHALPRSIIAPFDKDHMGSRILHMGMGTLLGVLPSTYLMYLTLSPTTGVKL